MHTSRTPLSIALLLLAAACSSSATPGTRTPGTRTSVDASAGADDAAADASRAEPDAAVADAAAADAEPVAQPDAGEALPDAAAPPPTALERAVAQLSGRFDSAAQAAADRRYFAISLVVCPVVAPELGEHVLYVEQARAESPRAPYRQRIYVVSTAGDEVVSSVYELAAPAAAVGACADPSRLTPTPATVIERAGCSVYLRPDGDGFVGATRGQGCASSLQGASYATSEVTMTPTGLRSWDRGFDAAGTQVWGAVAGPYEFVRQP
jgi:CpeT protein